MNINPTLSSVFQVHKLLEILLSATPNNGLLLVIQNIHSGKPKAADNLTLPT